jgi:hypothetical protein
MSREVHVRFREGAGVRLPRATRLLLGLAGPKAEAEEVKMKLASFLGTTLNLTMAEEKTLVTHATQERARVLGYEIGIMESQTKYDNRRRRAINGKVGLYIPEDVIQRKRQSFLQKGKAIHRPELLNDSEFGIICLYQWEYRGVVEYYLMAQNTYRLGVVKWTMETSLLKTLAAKNRTSVHATARRLSDIWHTPNGPRKCLKLTVPREGKKPVVAMVGGLSLARRRSAAIKDQVIMPYIDKRSGLIERLVKDTCEVCGARGAVEVHHVRKLADLKKKGQKEKPLWRQIMVARQRKTLVVCHDCHMGIHHNRHKIKASDTGEPDDAKGSRPVRRGAGGKGA